MPLFPSLTFEIESPLKTEGVLARLRNGIEPRRWLRFSHQHRTFEGVIAGNRFDVRRIIHERNAFLPRVSGEISTIVGGTCLTGTMRVHRFVAAFPTISRRMTPSSSQGRAMERNLTYALVWSRKEEVWCYPEGINSAWTR
jgi:hypothetical protein